MDVEIQYELEGRGWSVCRLEIYGQACTVTALYWSNALGHFVDAVNHLLQGGRTAQFSFAEEPGEYRWTIERDEDRGVTVRIFEFPDWVWRPTKDSDAVLIFEATCPLHDFGKALANALGRLLEEHGIAGYHREWAGDEFPVEETLTLCRLVGMPPYKQLLNEIKPGREYRPRR